MITGSNDQAKRVIIEGMKKTFLRTPEGKQTLEWMLAQMGVWSIITEPDELALRNFAIELLILMDVYTDENASSIVDSFSKLRGIE